MMKCVAVFVLSLAFVAVATSAYAQTPQPRFIYVVNRGSNNVSAYTISATTGALTPIAGSPFPAGSLPVSVAVDPSGRYAYVANEGSGNISAYTIDATTGALRPVPGSPFAASGSSPHSVAVDPLGRFVYVEEGEGLNAVSAYALASATGALVSIPGSPFPAGSIPRSVTVDPSGRFVYVANGGGSQDVSAYTINATTGALTPISGSPFPAGARPVSVTVDPLDRFVYVANKFSCDVSAYTLNAATGALTPVSGSPFSISSFCGARSVTVDPSGAFLYVATEPNDGVWAFTINATSGALALTAGSPFSAGLAPEWVTVDSTGRFAYVVNSASNNLSGFIINASNGALMPITGSPFAAGLFPISATTSPCSVRVQALKQGVFPRGDRNPSWEDNLYDNSVSSTIYQLGCALTSLSMALNFAGVANDPGSLNQFMVTNGAYNGLNVTWDKTSRLISGGRLKFDTLGGFKNSITNPKGARQALESALCGPIPHPVIVGVDLDSNGVPQHFVLVTAKQGNQFLIEDPFFPKGTLNDYGNSFETRGIVRDPSSDISGLDLALGDNADLLVIDEIGRRTGFDSIARERPQEIPGSAHFIDALRNDETGEPPTESGHSVQIFQPQQGTYRVILVGLKLGTYVLIVSPFSQDGSAQPEVRIPGISVAGSTSTFQIQFMSTPGALSTVVRVASFDGTLADINSSFQLGLIDNEGIANSLSSKIHAAAAAAARGQTQTKRDILGAFENEVNAQAGRHLFGTALQILLEDADSLLSQNP